MKVKELIEKLKALPQESEVLLGYSPNCDFDPTHYIPLEGDEVQFNEDVWNEDMEEEDSWKDVVTITFVSPLEDEGEEW